MQAHTKTDRIIDGGSSNSHDRPPRKSAPGRECAAHGCRTRLSIYNDSPFCALHHLCAAPRRRRIRPSKGTRIT